MPVFTLTLAVFVLETRTGDVQQIIMSLRYVSELWKEKSAVPVLTDVHFDLWPGYASWERHGAEVKIASCNDHLRNMLRLLGQMNSALERRANVNIICSVCVPASCDVLSVVVWEELLFVETNHRLMEVAVEMGGKGASVCLSPSVSKPQTPFCWEHSLLSQLHWSSKQVWTLCCPMSCLHISPATFTTI